MAKIRAKPVDVTAPDDEVQRQSCEEAKGRPVAFLGVSADFPPCDTTVVRRIESIEKRKKPKVSTSLVAYTKATELSRVSSGNRIANLGSAANSKPFHLPLYPTLR